MIEQTDVDKLLSELESMRNMLQDDREALVPQLETLLARTAQMRRDAAGGKFEPAIVSVDNLLKSFSAGVLAQVRLNQVGT